MPKFHLFTMVWGTHHLGLFKRSCFRSMNWPKNREAITGSTWNIFTKPEHFEELEQLFKDQPYKLQLFAIGDSMRVSGCGFVKTSQCDQGVISLNGLRDQIQYSIQHKSKMLLAPPDTIFGDGSVRSMLEIGTQPGTCVAVVHPRVLPTILDDIETIGATRGSMSNAQMVTLAIKHAHSSWTAAEFNSPICNSYIGGISWRKIGAGVVSVTHRLPTVYLADFNGTDWDFFWSQVSWGGWDHRWPAENLIRQERMRLIGSSDAAFICEITDWDKNVPPKHDHHPKDDSYWNDHYHNGINRQFSVIFRGE